MITVLSLLNGASSHTPSAGPCHDSSGVNPKGAGRKEALRQKEKSTCRVRARGGGWRDAACADVASRAGATVDGHCTSYDFEQWVNGDDGQDSESYDDDNR